MCGRERESRTREGGRSGVVDEWWSGGVDEGSIGLG